MTAPLTCPACGSSLSKVGDYWMCYRPSCDFHYERGWTDAELLAEVTADRDRLRGENETLRGALDDIWHTAQGVGSDEARVFFDIASAALTVKEEVHNG